MPAPDEESCELWWDAQLAWGVFMDVSSPWKFSMNGIAGIDDLALIAVLELHPIQLMDRLEVLRDVQSAARGALRYINEQQEKPAAK